VTKSFARFNQSEAVHQRDAHSCPDKGASRMGMGHLDDDTEGDVSISESPGQLLTQD
jgi:hypothetical protein